MDGETVRILIVDDRPENLLALEAVLSSLRVDTVRAGSGDEALYQLLQHDFSLILLDAQMPGMDGYQTAALIRRREKSARIPIIFLTAIDKSPSQVFRGYAAGAVDFIFKPFDPEVLRSKVRVFMDIFNHQRQLEIQTERLRISEERYALTAAGAADGLWDWDLQKNKIYYSPRWTEIANYEENSTDDSILTWWNRIDPQDLPRVQREIEDHLQGRTAHFESEHRLRIGPGEERWVLARGLAIRKGDQNPVRMAGSLSDITARKRAEADAMQKERLATIGMTMANISHSIKNVFTVLAGATSLMERQIDPTDSQLQETFGMIQSSGQRLHMIVMNMLDFSKKRESLREKVSVAGLFSELKRLLHGSAIKNAGILEFIIEPGAELILHDGDRLLHSLLNLGGNALDALPREGGKVVFHAAVGNALSFELTGEELMRHEKEDCDVLLIEICDNGSGISEENMKKIFEPFFSTKASRGTGLGLPSVRQFVEDSGGFMRVNSKENAGSVFQMFFFDRLPSRICTAA